MYNQEAAKRMHIGGGMQPAAQVGTMTTAGSAIAAALAVGSGSAAMLEMGATNMNGAAQTTNSDPANTTLPGRKRPNADQQEAQQGGSNSNSAGSGGAAACAPPPPPQQQLKCPRCESRNTKFCYYNNYSTSQPRHFCKNCRRYWTQGGALRNVPVGGGCRKNKRSSAAAAAATASAAAASSLMSKMHCRAGMQLDPMGHLQHPGGADPNSILSRLTSTFPPSLNDPEFLKVALSRFSATPPGLLGGADAGLLFDSAQIPGHFKGGSLLGPRQVSPLTSFDPNVQMDMNFLGASAGASPNIYHPADPRAAGLTPLQLYDNQSKLLGTSATATLASLEDQLSSFSNVTSINDSQLSSGQQQLSTKEQAEIENNHNHNIHGVYHDQDEKLPLQLLGNNSSDQGVGHPNLVDPGSAHFGNDQAQAATADQGSWMHQQQQQQQHQHQMGQEMQNMFHENHHSAAGLWGHHSTRWQDMHPLASTTTALELH